jgi:ribosomal protein S18 acetylase RimI-like enzyme
MTIAKNSTIRTATIEDVTLLANLSKSTFIDTYWGTDTDENILQYVATHFNEVQIANEITLFPLIYYKIMEHEGQAVGYAKLRKDANLTPANLRDKNCLEIARIYITKALHGQQIGQKLLTEIETEAQKQEINLLWLCVWKDNAKAINFYHKMGFTISGEYIFYLGTTRYVDWAMAKEI